MSPEGNCQTAFMSRLAVTDPAAFAVLQEMKHLVSDGQTWRPPHVVYTNQVTGAEEYYGLLMPFYLEGRIEPIVAPVRHEATPEEVKNKPLA
jgi:hypothetical protein